MAEFSPQRLKNKQYEYEEAFLNPYATKSNTTKGRERKEEECPYRTDFQRDRDRILHCKSFRRLKHKTQVFFSPEDDHYRTRLTHTLEVAQISRSIARLLRLNEDLTEAIALGHDLGHTPFGHIGENALNEIMTEGFHHSMQSVRVVKVIENLNLCAETIDGISKHSMGGCAPVTLEGQVVKLSDKIAYLNHDLDDAIRAGIVQIDKIPSHLINYLGKSRGEMVNTIVRDVIKNSYENNEIIMSAECKEIMLEFREWMFKNVYFSKRATSDEFKIKRIINELFSYYLEHVQKISPQCNNKCAQIAVKDYIAGMTDRYADKKYRKLFLPNPMSVSIEDETDKNLMELLKKGEE